MSRPTPRLEDLQASADSLLGVLKQESEALAGDNLRQLESVTDEKRAVLDSLIEFAEDELKNAHQNSPRWEEFVNTLTECKRRNMINGATMSGVANSRQEALRVLFGQESSANDSDYNASGQMQQSAQSRILGKG